MQKYPKELKCSHNTLMPLDTWLYLCTLEKSSIFFAIKKIGY